MLTAALAGATAKSVSGRILTAPAVTSHNSFASPHTVEPVKFDGATLADGKLTINLPAKSVVVLTLE
jgi:alpha-N-arabinofuranosidase